MGRILLHPWSLCGHFPPFRDHYVALGGHFVAVKIPFISYFLLPYFFSFNKSIVSNTYVFEINTSLRVVKSTFFDVENCLVYIFVKMRGATS